MSRRNARYTLLDVDGPVPLDMLRAVRGIRRDALAFLAECVRRYGDLVAFPLPKTPVLLVNDPDGVRRVLLEGHARYGKATVQYTSLSLVTGIGLLTAEQEQWRPRRRVDQPAFRHAALPDVAASAARAASSLRDEWDQAPGHVLDAEQAVLRAMLDVVTETLFDTDLETVAPDEHLGRRLVEAVDDALHVVIDRAQLPLPPWLARWYPPARRSKSRLAAANTLLDDACARIVAARRARGVSEEDGDLLALLLRAVQAGVLSEREVRDELVTMVIAGHETVASGLTWALHLLATHPQVQHRLAHELEALDGALADRSDGAPDDAWAPGWDDLAKLPYTRAVLDETLRLYPPAWVITRTALEADTIAGVQVPAGTLVIICPWLLHRREQVWPDPQRFDPERFLAGRSRPSGDYLPFGLGPRLCIGRDFALVEGVLVLAGLLRGREVLPAWRHPGVSDVPVDALVTLRPHGGMPLRVVERRRH